MYQSTVNSKLAFGFPGELFKGGPLRARPGNIQSAGPNTIGFAFTKVAGTDGYCTVGGTPGEDAPFYGILANQKEYALRGTTAGSLVPSLNLPQFSPGDFVYMSTGLIVTLGNAANEGDFVDFVIATGALVARASTSGSPATGNANIPGAVVKFFSIPSAGLAVIELNS
jgi:hypothetical protein